MPQPPASSTNSPAITHCKVMGRSLCKTQARDEAPGSSSRPPPRPTCSYRPHSVSFHSCCWPHIRGPQLLPAATHLLTCTHCAAPHPILLGWHPRPTPALPIWSLSVGLHPSFQLEASSRGLECLLQEAFPPSSALLPEQLPRPNLPGDLMPGWGTSHLTPPAWPGSPRIVWPPP